MEIVFHNTFQKKFQKLPVKIQKQFYKRLDFFLRDKFDQTLNNHSVERAFPYCRSINITGDYRAIFKDCDDSVVFLNIGTHSELYS